MMTHQNTDPTATPEPVRVETFDIATVEKFGSVIVVTFETVTIETAPGAPSVDRDS